LLGGMPTILRGMHRSPSEQRS